MATQQEATFSGVEMNDVRPGAVVGLETTDAIARGQSHVYEVLTGLASPGAAGRSATPHVHDGVDGCPIRVPIAQGVIDADLPGIDPIQSTVTPGWQAFAYVPFWIPAGFSEISIVLCGYGGYVESTVRVVMQDNTLADIDYPRPVARVTRDHYFSLDGTPVFEARVAVNPGAFNVLRLEAWAGKSRPGADDDDDGPFLGSNGRFIHSWHALPVDNAPADAFQARYPSTGSQELDRAVLTTFDSAQTQIDEGLDAHFLREASQNDGLLRELGTGRAAGGGTEAQRQLTGHRHADDGLVDLDDSGKLVDASLGAWGYGVVRRIAATDTARPSFDEVASSTAVGNSWSGKIISPVLTGVTTSTIAAKHRFRIPATKTSNLTGTSKVKYAVLCWKGDATSVDISVGLGDHTDGNLDTITTATTTGTGAVLVTGEVDAEVDGSAATTQDDQKALVTLSVQSSAAKAENFALYGLALGFEA